MLHKTGVLGHAVEGRSFVLQQLLRRGKLCDGSLVQHDNFVRVENRVESMGDREHGAISEFSANGFLLWRNKVS